MVPTRFVRSQSAAAETTREFIGYFCGNEYYEPGPPCAATQIGRFPTAIREAGVEELLKASIDAAVATKAVRP